MYQNLLRDCSLPLSRPATFSTRPEADIFKGPLFFWDIPPDKFHIQHGRSEHKHLPVQVAQVVWQEARIFREQRQETVLEKFPFFPRVPSKYVVYIGACLRCLLLRKGSWYWNLGCMRPTWIQSSRIGPQYMASPTKVETSAHQWRLKGEKNLFLKLDSIAQTLYQPPCELPPRDSEAPTRH